MEKRKKDKMKFYTESSLKNFKAWSGGYYVLSELSGDAFDIVESYLEEFCDSTEVSEAEINDFLWFEAEDFLREEFNMNLDGTRIED